MKFNVRAIINKANGQITASFPKKKLPKKFLDLVRKNPDGKRILKINIEDYL